MNYFKKEVPKTPILMPNGDRLQFESADGVVGIYSTGDAATVTHLRQLQLKRIGGVTEIPEAEYQELVKKKGGSTQSGKNWREEVGSAFQSDTMLPRQTFPTASQADAVAPAAEPKAPATRQAPKPPARPPNVGKRS